jgi:isochorismate synthase
VARAGRAAERALAEIRTKGAVAPVVVGALPFDGTRPATLIVPRTAVIRREGEPAWRVTVSPDGIGGSESVELEAPVEPDLPRGEDEPTVSPVVSPVPSPEEFLEGVSEARARIRAGALDKVVLARTLVVRTGSGFDLGALVRRLRDREPDAYVFAAQGFVGASPELLVARSGVRVTSNPLAGTARRRTDPAEDETAATALLASQKDLGEHAPVAESVVRALSPLCSSLEVEGPSAVATGTVWHLSTEVIGTLTAPAPSALHLASLLHPTPAVCGAPTEAALAVIGELERFDRGLYGGIVGWMDANGDGEWAVALRCAEVSGRTATLFAGAGIVADSEPQAELAETDAKFASMLGALGA